STYLPYIVALHDALPISMSRRSSSLLRYRTACLAFQFSLTSSRKTGSLSVTPRSTSSTTSNRYRSAATLCPPLSLAIVNPASPRSEEHTSELQSRFDLVC